MKTKPCFPFRLAIPIDLDVYYFIGDGSIPGVNKRGWWLTSDNCRKTEFNIFLSEYELVAGRKLKELMETSDFKNRYLAWKMK